jgi:hypothetical protein
MTQQTPLPPKHLVFRPSAAKRWLSCPGSTWISTAVQTRSSPYAVEGTTAHAHLSHFLTGRPVEEFLKEEDPVVELPAEDVELVRSMATLIQDMAALDGMEIHVEQKIRRQFGGHMISGTADVILLSKNRLGIFDYKHGAGKRVEVASNPQITLYLLMALDKYKPAITNPQDLEMGIIQPRGRGDGLTTWNPPQSYLENFEKNVEAAVRRAYVAEPTFNPGPWCQFCAGETLGACPAKLMEAVRFAVALEEEELREYQKGPVGRSLDRIQNAISPLTGHKTIPEVVPSWWLLDYARTAETVAKNIHAEAVERLKEGGEVPGWTLKDKLGNRRWREAGEIPDVLARITGATREDFMKPAPAKPISISDAKHHPLLKGHDLDQYVERPLKRVLVHAEEVPESYLEEVE